MTWATGTCSPIITFHPKSKMVVPLCGEIFRQQTHTPIDWKFYCASFAVWWYRLNISLQRGTTILLLRQGNVGRSTITFHPCTAVLNVLQYPTFRYLYANCTIGPYIYLGQNALLVALESTAKWSHLLVVKFSVDKPI